MSLRFSGWKVLDSETHHGELRPGQKPHRRGTYTMYHGTTINNAKLIIANGFKQSDDGLLGKGVYVTRDIYKAASYPKVCTTSNRVILTLKVRLGRVKRITDNNDPLRTTWSSNGYDTAWVPPDCKMAAVPSGLQENCVFDPSRVKVVGIARAHTPAMERELLHLLKKNQGDRGDRGDQDVCQACRRKTHRDVPHILQQCWSCNKLICILSIEHKCRRKP